MKHIHENKKRTTHAEIAIFFEGRLDIHSFKRIKLLWIDLAESEGGEKHIRSQDDHV